MASPKRPSPPAITASHLPQQQLSLSFSRLSPMGGCFRSGLPERPAASGTAPGGKASIFLCASPGQPPQLRYHAFVADLPLHSTAAPWLCRTSPRCLWCVCVWMCACGGVCVCVCQTWCRLLVTLVLWGARTGRDMAGGQRLAGTPLLRVGRRSAWVSGHGKGFEILPKPLPVLPGLTTAPWVSRPIALARSRSGAATPSSAPWAGSSLPTQDKPPPSNWVIFPPCDPF